MNFHVRKSTMRNESTVRKSEQKKTITQFFFSLPSKRRRGVIVKSCVITYLATQDD